MKKLHYVILLDFLLLLLFPAALCIADYNSGVEAYQNADYKTAVQEFSKLAKEGMKEAQFNLALMYYNGEGVSQDITQAVNWWNKSASQGHPPAQFNLGKLYERGEGVKQDYQEAALWFRKAAEAGHKDAQFKLAEMYERGKGVLRDYIQVYKWFSLAAGNGHTEAQEERDYFAQEMTEEQIAEAKRLVEQWKSEHK